MAPPFFSKIDLRSPLFPQEGKAEDWRTLFASLEEPLWYSFQKTKIQQPATVWSLRLCFALAQELIDQQGHIDLQKVQEALDFLRAHANPCDFASQTIRYRLAHIRRVLNWLSLAAIKERLEKIGRSSVSGSEKWLTLCAGAAGEKSPQIDQRWIRICIVSAWLHYLRQIVGSCFATAPAILIQQHQPEMFLRDMQQIIETGCLKRIVQGQELQVPAASDPGIGDLRKKIENPTDLIESPGIIWSLFRTLEKSSWSPNDREKEEKLRLHVVEELLLFQEPLCADKMFEGYLCHSAGVQKLRFRQYLTRPLEKRANGSVHIESSLVGSEENLLALLAEQYRSAQDLFSHLTEHPLQRIWEFTLASFSEASSSSHTGQALWSLHTGLGLHPEEPHGIAERLYQILQERVEQYKEKSLHLKAPYEDMAYQVDHLMVRIQHAREERELQWLRADLQNVQAQRNQLLEEIEGCQRKAQSFADLFPTLLDTYISLCDRYFHQIYDPQMGQTASGIYEDAPAGFRLLFTGGRRLASSWTSLHTSEQYIDAVARFLVLTEQEILSQEAFLSIKNDFAEIVTILIQHIRSDLFLTKAFGRMAKALRIASLPSSIEEQEASPVKPWAYISGGTMKGLLAHYYEKAEPPEEKTSWFQEIQELWVFLIDGMKEMPALWSERFCLDPSLCLLMHSDRHAFLFLPGHPTFVESWSESIYPYTWIRDSYLLPARQAYSGCLLEREPQELLIAQLVAETRIAVFKPVPEALPPSLWREKMVEQAKAVASCEIGRFCQTIDSLLLRLLPISPSSLLLARLEEFFSHSSWLGQKIVRQKRIALWAFCQKKIEEKNWVTAQEVLQIFSQALRSQTQNACSNPLPTIELYQELTRFQILLPLPVFFADSNWDHEQFAFVLSPGTDQLELWRLQPDSQIGYPMHDWKALFREKASSSLWGLYSNPKEYLEIGWQSSPGL